MNIYEIGQKVCRESIRVISLYQNDNSWILTQEQTITLSTVISLNTRYLFNIKEDIFFHVLSIG